MKLLFTGLLLSTSIFMFAQEPAKWQGKFEQLDHVLPTPNEYRTGSGSPGAKYWQQKADYTIAVELNDADQSISGTETITYHNNSPDALGYLWLQLDQNILSSKNTLNATTNSTLMDAAPAKTYAEALSDFKGGYNITKVTDTNGKPLPFVINNTMMRIDLAQSLISGDNVSFSIEWSYNINDRNIFGERSGFEFFPEDQNHLYTIAQFFPRMCVYDDFEGWQNKQYLGQGEFALTFGDYKVRITVPADHIVAATGELKNAQEVLSKAELERFEKAKNTFDRPVFIVTEAEAIQHEKSRSTAKKSWEFQAENVRDFAFASSRKFIWDAQAVKIGNKTPLAMSFYPKEGNPLWQRESTKAVKNTLEVYSRFTIDYPYPVAISVHTASLGMEYPMICFNYGRPTKDGKISPKTRQAMIGVIVHEVGHNFFPMIVNSDERQTTWMDEGINSFVQLLTELERYPGSDFKWTRGIPAESVPYLRGNKTSMRPLMVNAEQVVNLSSEQYAKAASGLFMLRETIMGRELFDQAFKEYAKRWAFKHPKPADFFRTMEDASAVDLDWFWNGWFYSTEQCDIAIDKIKWFRLKKPQANPEEKTINVRPANSPQGERYQDFNGGPEPLTVNQSAPEGEFLSSIDDNAILKTMDGKNIYEVTLINKGGLVMPVILEWTFKDGTKQIERIPAEIWRLNETKTTKVFYKDKEVVAVILDPHKETADINDANNFFPKTGEDSKFDQFKKKAN
jgi:hypothetical protein